MTNIADYRDRSVLVLGAGGVTGKAARKLAARLGARVICVDDKAPRLATGETSLAPLEVAGARAWEAWLARVDSPSKVTVVISPGFPRSRPEVGWLEDRGLEVWGEAGWARGFISDIPAFGITGTDGKSTLTSFVAQLLRAGGFRSEPCGNFGLPLSELAARKLDGEILPEILVMELSSYQLEAPGNLNLSGALLSNIAPDHLNRYPGPAAYFLSKLNILDCLPTDGDFLVGNFAGNFEAAWRDWLSEKERQTVREKMSGKSLLFLGDPPPGDGGLNGAGGKHNLREAWDLPFLAGGRWPVPAEIPKRGDLYLRNSYTAALCCDRLLARLRPSKIPAGDRDNILNTLGRLETLPHRLEELGALDGVRYVNDSKATTLQATQNALASFWPPDGGERPPIHLLLGGQDKGAPFGELLIPFFRAENKKASLRLYPFGQAGPLIHGSLAGYLETQRRKPSNGPDCRLEEPRPDLEAALEAVRGNARAGDIVLLSPACTSWDAFASFAARGEFFRAWFFKPRN